MPRYPCVDTGDGVSPPGGSQGLPNIDPTKARRPFAFHNELERAICANAGRGIQAILGASDYGTDQPKAVRPHPSGPPCAGQRTERLDAARLVPCRGSAVPLGCTSADDTAFGRTGLFVQESTARCRTSASDCTDIVVLLEPNFEGPPASEVVSPAWTMPIRWESLS